MRKEREFPSDTDLTPVKKDYTGLKKLEYFLPNIVRLDLPFILTEDKMLVLNMPYLKLEGQHVDAVRLLDVWDKDEIVNLKIQDLKTNKINVLSHNLKYSGNYWLWCLAEFEYLIV